MDKKGGQGNLIYCKDEDLKESLIKCGIPLLMESDGYFVFVNTGCKNINFEDYTDKVIFTNKMSFI